MKTHASVISTQEEFEFFADRGLMHLGAADVQGATFSGEQFSLTFALSSMRVSPY
jgi:hypothetical protein